MSGPPFCMDCRVEPGNDVREIVLATRRRVRALPKASSTRLPHQGPQRRGRSADRRIFSHVRATHPDVASRICAGAEAAPQTSVRSLRNSSASGTARLSALRRGTRQAGRNQRWLSSRPALPETRLDGRYPFSPVSSLPSTSETGRSAGRSGPRAARKPGNPPVSKTTACNCECIYNIVCAIFGQEYYR
jgi:hypothetical protein